MDLTCLRSRPSAERKGKVPIRPIEATNWPVDRIRQMDSRHGQASPAIVFS